MLSVGDICSRVTFLLTGVMYVMQYFYQKGALYRLRALGERHDMDITVGKICV